MKNKEEDKDRGLRQALQHRNEAAERMTLSEDFTDRLMERIREQEQKPKSKSKSRHSWIHVLVGAAAASMILLLAFHHLYNREATKAEQPVAVTRPEHHGNKPQVIEKEPIPIAKDEKAVVAKTTKVSKRTKSPVSDNKASTTVSVTDSLDYYIDKIERELTQVDESLYIERMAKVVSADERLQRIVNSYILHTFDKDGRPQTADNMYNVKSEQDEE